VRAIEPSVTILVAPDRLGVLHDVTACARKVIVLSAPRTPDASTGTNAAELESLGIAHVIASFPRALWDEPQSLEQAERIWRFVTTL
jgi:dethiobiotin synthetase